MIEREHRLIEERDLWVRLFNRLDAAINHHKRDTAAFASDADDRLYAARDRITASAKPAAGLFEWRDYESTDIAGAAHLEQDRSEGDHDE